MQVVLQGVDGGTIHAVSEIEQWDQERPGLSFDHLEGETINRSWVMNGAPNNTRHERR
jgi:hypothetical protein